MLCILKIAIACELWNSSKDQNKLCSKNADLLKTIIQVNINKSAVICFQQIWKTLFYMQWRQHMNCESTVSKRCSIMELFWNLLNSDNDLGATLQNKNFLR